MSRPADPGAAAPAPATGDPTPWVLLRGLTRGTGHWGDWPAQWQARQGAPVITLDLPGNGQAWQRRSPADVAGLTAAARATLADQLQRRHLHGPVHLLALSMGAMVAAHWARLAPAELRSVVLVNSSWRGISPWHQRLRPPALLRLLGCLLAPVSDRHWETTLFDLTSRRPDLREPTLAHWLALRRAQPVSRANALRQLLAAARFRPANAAPALPVLVLGSAGDALVDPRCSEALARAWRAPLRQHTAAGHDLPLDAPDWLIEQLLAWTATTAGPPDHPPAGGSLRRG